VKAALVVALPLTLLLSAAGLAAPPPAGANDTARADIPASYLGLYRESGARFAVPWQLLAAIGRVESDHGQNPACYRPNEAGAIGPMQFLPATFREYSWAPGVLDPDPLNPHDAILAAGAMLQNDGASTDLSGAIYAYNHSASYVALVLSWAHRYGWQ